MSVLVRFTYRVFDITVEGKLHPGGRNAGHLLNEAGRDFASIALSAAARKLIEGKRKRRKKGGTLLLARRCVSRHYCNQSFNSAH